MRAPYRLRTLHVSCCCCLGAALRLCLSFLSLHICKSGCVQLCFLPSPADVSHISFSTSTPCQQHLPLKGLPVVLFSSYSTLLLSLNSLFSHSVKHNGRNDFFYSLFHPFLDQFKESLACGVICGGWILIRTKQETAAMPSQIIKAAIVVNAGS